MPPDPVDLADIEFLKDVLLAEYHSTTLRWNAVQVAGLSVLAVGFGGYVGGGLRAEGFLLLLVTGLGLIAMAVAALDLADRRYARECTIIRKRLQRLKERK